MRNKHRFNLIKKHYTQGRRVSDIARILILECKENPPSFGSMRSLVYWYVRNYKLKRGVIKII